MMRWRTWICSSGLLVCAACGLSGAGSLPGVGGGRDEDRVVVASFGEIVGVAASQRLVFAASAEGLATYDQLTGSWMRPLSAVDGYPVGRVTTIVADPDLDAAWIGGLGEVLFYRPALQQIVRTLVGGRVDRIVFDRGEPGAGAFVNVGGQWTRITPAGFAVPAMLDEVPPPERQVRAPTLDDLYTELPSFRGLAGILTRDESLTSWQPTSGARILGRSELWVGTLGGGLFRLDPPFNRSTHVPYGLFDSGASALALDSDGVWVGALGRERGETGGVAFTNSALDQWRWLRGPSDRSMAGMPVRDIIIRDGAVWVATDRGVASREVRSSSGSPRSDWKWVGTSELGTAHALAAVDGGVWAGTDRGLVFIRSGAGARSDLIPGVAVRALLTTGDTLWAGTDAGLMTMSARDATGRLAPAIEPIPLALRRGIRALARSDSVLAVATEDEVHLIDLRGGRSTPPAIIPGLRSVAPIYVVAIDARSIWVGGGRGVVAIDRVNGGVRSIMDPRAPVQPVFDIALQPGFAWLATPGGLVRLRRLPDGGVR